MNAIQPALLLYAYQRRWVNDDARFKIAMFARQCGKTFTSTLELALDCARAEALGQRRRWVILSRGERQAREAMNEGVKLHLAALSAGFKAYDYDWSPGVKALEVELPGGSKITALPANPDTARGFSANVLLDEFAFHQDSRAIWKALFPVISKPGLKLRVISTPNGKGNKFYDLMTGKDDGWSRHTTDIYQAVADGLPRDIEELRRGAGDDDLLQILGQFLEVLRAGRGDHLEDLQGDGLARGEAGRHSGVRVVDKLGPDGQVLLLVLAGAADLQGPRGGVAERDLPAGAGRGAGRARNRDGRGGLDREGVGRDHGGDVVGAVDAGGRVGPGDNHRLSDHEAVADRGDLNTGRAGGDARNGLGGAGRRGELDLAHRGRMALGDDFPDGLVQEVFGRSFLAGAVGVECGSPVLVDPDQHHVDRVELGRAESRHVQSFRLSTLTTGLRCQR